MATLAFRNGAQILIHPGEAVLRSDLLAYGGRWVRAEEHPHVAVQAAPSPDSNALFKFVASAAVGALAAWALDQLLSDPEPRRIEELAQRLERRGADVCADIKGWCQPQLLNGRRPDVHGTFANGREVAIEVENGKSISSSHTRGQVTDLEQWAARSSRRTFKLVVVAAGRGGKS